jgi:hypothetical protein
MMKVSIRDYFRLRLYDVLTTGGLSVRARVDEFVGGLESEGLLGDCVRSRLTRAKVDEVTSEFQKSGDFVKEGGDVNWKRVFNDLTRLVDDDSYVVNLYGPLRPHTLSIECDGVEIYRDEGRGMVDYKGVMSYIINFFLVHKKMIVDSTKDKSGDVEIMKGMDSYIEFEKGGPVDGSKTNPFKYDEVGQSSPAVLLTPGALVERGFHETSRDTYRSGSLGFRFTNVGVELIFKTPSGKFDIIGRYDGGIPEDAAMVLYGALRFHTLESISTLMAKGVSIPKKMKVEGINGDPGIDSSEEDFEVVDRKSSPLEDEVEILSDKLTDVEISLKSLSQRFSKLNRIDIYTELESILKSKF